MRDITINNEESQNKNQETTPVTESPPKQKEAINSLPSAIISSWLGWRDSNPRMLGPEPSALPLGDIPLVLQEIVPLVPGKLKALSQLLTYNPLRPATIRFASW